MKSSFQGTCRDGYGEGTGRIGTPRYGSGQMLEGNIGVVLAVTVGCFTPTGTDLSESLAV